MGCAGWGKLPSLERSSYRVNKSKQLVTRVGEDSHPIGNMNGAYWATFVELDHLPKFSSCTRSSLNGDDRVGEEKLAEQRKKERHRREVVQLHGRLAEMVGSICEWLLKDTICMIWHQRGGQILGLLPNAKQSNPGRKRQRAD